MTEGSPAAAPAAATGPALELRGITAGYNGGPAVLENVQLEIGSREYLAIIGPNGGGKTTLLRVLLGLVEPRRGSVVSHLPHGRKRLGYVPQYSTFEAGVPLRVEEVVLMGRISRRGLGRRYRREDREAARRALEAVHLEDRAQEPATELSGGQIQRVLIARALAGEPEAMLLDEPLASLDVESRRVVRELLLELHRTMPVVLVTHDPAAVAQEVQSIACVNRSLTYHGSGELTSEVLEETYGCPVDLIAHGVPHRVLAPHSHEGSTSGHVPAHGHAHGPSQDGSGGGSHE
ncbi:MAG: metal ABC transporter ATP-binding protein [Acidobacteriota bacterium]|nr:metal ABC transporter ATP-binding protein [Acidobacteriota bacterium]